MQKTNNLLTAIAVLAILIPLAYTMASAQNKQDPGSTQTVEIQLTKEEKAFLNSHPVIRFGTDYRWEPYAIKKADGSIEGFDVDLVKYINEQTGANIQIVTGRWAEIVEQAKERKIDGLATSSVSKERGLFFDFSNPYTTLFPVFVVAGNSRLKIEKIDDFAGKSVAILKGNQFYLNLLGKYPSINVIESSSEIDAIKLTIEGKADAAIVATTFYNNYIKTFGKDIKIGYVATDAPLELVYSVRKDWPELVSIINKALSSLPMETKNSLFSRWFGLSPEAFGLEKKEERISLTEQEQAWLNEHPVIRVVQDPGWPPVEFTDEQGMSAGISEEYLSLVEQRLGVKFERVRDQKWKEAYPRLKRWEIDMTTSVAVTPQRTEFWAFTKPYLNIPIVIATQMDVTYIADLRELIGKKVAVVENYAIDEWLSKDFPEIQRIHVKKTLEGLEMLQRGEIFAYIDNLLVIGYYQAKLGASNIKIAGQTPYVNAQCMAVRKDWAPLAGILQKALESIPETQRNDIYRKWLPVRYEHGFNYTLFWQVLGVFVVILLVMVFWNWKLAREIRSRKQVEESLRESEDKFKYIFDHSFIGKSITYPNGDMQANKALYEMLGYSEEEFMDLKWQQITHPDDVEFSQRVIDSLLSREKDSERFIKKYLHKDGSVVWTDVSTALRRDKEGKPLYFMTTISNITDRRKAEEDKKSYETQLRQSQKMESIGTLAGGVAHEINNPINGIMNYAQLIKDKTTDGNPLSEYADEIIHETIRVSTIVRNLLTFARQDKETHSPARFRDIVDNTISLIQTVFKQDQISLEIDVPEDLPKIKCRSQQIQQVLMNLITNARDALNEKYSGYDENKKISVSSSLFKKKGRRWIRTTVKDWGIGMSPDIVEKIFDPFFTTKGRTAGTGLGLSISYGIVKDHHGELNVESEPGHFTRFHMDLPVDSE